MPARSFPSAVYVSVCVPNPGVGVTLAAFAAVGIAGVGLWLAG